MRTWTDVPPNKAGRFDVRCLHGDGFQQSRVLLFEKEDGIIDVTEKTADSDGFYYPSLQAFLDAKPPLLWSPASKEDA